MQAKDLKRIKRQKRIRARISGTSTTPRLRVFRSNKFIYAQLIDDESSKTILGTSDIKEKSGKKVDRAKKVGLEIGKQALGKKIKKVVFDRAGYKYHGRVKALADGAREGGLIF
jgi:large subunit ribosomal protein L18